MVYGTWHQKINQTEVASRVLVFEQRLWMTILWVPLIPLGQEFVVADMRKAHSLVVPYLGTSLAINLFFYLGIWLTRSLGIWLIFTLVSGVVLLLSQFFGYTGILAAFISLQLMAGWIAWSGIQQRQKDLRQLIAYYQGHS